MSSTKLKFPNYLNISLFLITFLLSLQINFDPPIWKAYGDPYDYLHQSKMPLSDKNFYFPEKTENFYPRPFTVPLFYKMVKSKPDLIIKLQKFFHYLGAFVLCAVLLLYLKKTYVKLIFVLFWYLFMSWWNITGWANTLLSESLSISLMFIWLASFLYYHKKRKLILLFLHIFVTILFSFTRDSWPYILLTFYTLYILSAIKWDKKMLIPYSIFLIMSIIIFFTQQHSANIGQRYRLPILNNIVFKILPNNNYISWFKEEGMPCADDLKKEYSNLNNYKEIYPLYNDTNYTELFNWVIKDGKTVYMKFLLTHPYKSFLFTEKSSDLKKIFAHNFGYIGPISGLAKLSHFIFPFFNIIFVLILFIIFIYLSGKEKSRLWLFPSIIIIVFTVNALILYNADALEVERHLFITNIMIQFMGIYLITHILDSKNFSRYTKIFGLWIKSRTS